jgi:hypothetical protein
MDVNTRSCIGRESPTLFHDGLRPDNVGRLPERAISCPSQPFNTTGKGWRAKDSGGILVLYGRRDRAQ